MKQILFLVLVCYLFATCNKTTNVEHVVYNKPLTGKGNVLQVTELKSNNETLLDLLTSDEFRASGVDVGLLNLQAVRKAIYVNTPISALEIPFVANSSKCVYAYTYRGDFIISIGEVKIKNGIQQFTQTNTEGEMIQQLTFTTDNTFVNYWTGTGSINKQFRVNSTEVNANTTCYATTKHFGDCMTCAINECNASFPCNWACGVSFGICSVGYAAACLGIGKGSATY